MDGRVRNVTRPSIESILHMSSQIFCSKYKQCHHDLICIDEAGFYVGDHGRFGYAKRGKRLTVKAARTLRQRKYTLIMAVNSRGVVDHKVLDHNCKKSDFISFLDGLPAPHGATLLMDNIAFHHSKETKDVVARKGFNQLFIPSYSPKFNAIEYVFGYMKPAYRALCPPNSDPRFDYKGAFVSIIERPLNLSAYFSHVLKSVNEALLDPHHVSGYDS